MLLTRKALLITDLSIKGYVSGSVSLFRRYQNRFLEMYGKELTGNVIELGGEKKYEHQKFFPNAASYLCTNVNRDFDEYLDITDMRFEDNSQDAYVCVSVVEHVYQIEKALHEVDRTLKVGGKVLLVVPFAYPIHDEKDYWRVSESFLEEFFKGYEILALAHLGGLVSTLVSALQRPRGILSGRFFFYKLLGMSIALAFRSFDRLDGFPMGYGMLAIKRHLPGR